MFGEAAPATADQVGPDLRARGMLFPAQRDILPTGISIATRVVEGLFDRGEASVERPTDIRAWLDAMIYTADYAAIADA